ncbi:MAG: hypothetical protein WCS73_00460 [Lentisphaeria bacterium]
MKSEMERLKSRLMQSFEYILNFDGFGHLEVDTKILKRGQKEVLIRSGREYRFVLDNSILSQKTGETEKAESSLSKS